jgi:hypothetical protein
MPYSLRRVAAYSSNLKMDVTRSSQTFVIFYQTTRCHTPIIFIVTFVRTSNLRSFPPARKTVSLITTFHLLFEGYGACVWTFMTLLVAGLYETSNGWIDEWWMNWKRFGRKLAWYAVTCRREWGVNMGYWGQGNRAAWRPGFEPRSSHMGFVVDKVALGTITVAERSKAWSVFDRCLCSVCR